MATQKYTQRLILEPDNSQRLANLCGHLNEHLQQIEKSLALKIQNRGNEFKLSGAQEAVESASGVLVSLYRTTGTATVNPDMVHLALRSIESFDKSRPDVDKPLILKTPLASIKPRGAHQQDYVESIQRHDINFGIGPAGTGKSWLAVAMAVHALNTKSVQRIILTRPAVEAGERLGFLPGDLAAKIDPYLRPLYDALHDMVGAEQAKTMLERQIVEVAPLAFMRGRTLNNSFVILDEAQNTTPEQMKMFLTRIGFGTKVVVTGDTTQVDVPDGRSGLRGIEKVLTGIRDLAFVHLDASDVVRHRIVADIVAAYETTEASRRGDAQS